MNRIILSSNEIPNWIFTIKWPVMNIQYSKWWWQLVSQWDIVEIKDKFIRIEKLRCSKDKIPFSEEFNEFNQLSWTFSLTNEYWEDILNKSNNLVSSEWNYFIIMDKVLNEWGWNINGHEEEFDRIVRRITKYGGEWFYK